MAVKIKRPTKAGMEKYKYEVAQEIGRPINAAKTSKHQANISKEG